MDNMVIKVIIGLIIFIAVSINSIGRKSDKDKVHKKKECTHDDDDSWIEPSASSLHEPKEVYVSDTKVANSHKADIQPVRKSTYKSGIQGTLGLKEENNIKSTEIKDFDDNCIPSSVAEWRKAIITSEILNTKF